MNDPKAGFIGKSVERKEDLRFLSGSGQFTDDITLPRQSYGAFVRSPHAHARIRAIDSTAAKAASGCSVSSPARIWPPSAGCHAVG
jgi:carbon-monoxide dehydrogenase large subunit